MEDAELEEGADKDLSAATEKAEEIKEGETTSSRIQDSDESDIDEALNSIDNEAFAKIIEGAKIIEFGGEEEAKEYLMNEVK